MDHIQHILNAAKTDLGSLHPLIVHFPIALLFIAPLFIILALIFFKSSRQFLISAAILMVIGTLFIFVAIKAGDLAADKIANSDPATLSTLGHHDHEADKSRSYFSILSAVFVVLTILFSFIKKLQSIRVQFPLLIIFLIAYAFGLLTLTETANYGGRLVHQHGVHTTLFDK